MVNLPFKVHLKSDKDNKIFYFLMMAKEIFT